MNAYERDLHNSFRLLCGIARIFAVFFLINAFTGTVTTVISAISMTGNPFGEIPDLWYALTDELWYTWGYELLNYTAAGVLWFANRPIARLCMPKIDPDACSRCGYCLKGCPDAPCPECGTERT